MHRGRFIGTLSRLVVIGLLSTGAAHAERIEIVCPTQFDNPNRTPAVMSWDGKTHRWSVTDREGDVTDEALDVESFERIRIPLAESTGFAFRRLRANGAVELATYDVWTLQGEFDHRVSVPPATRFGEGVMMTRYWSLLMPSGMLIINKTMRFNSCSYRYEE
jgi:hypothetical protein